MNIFEVFMVMGGVGRYILGVNVHRRRASGVPMDIQGKYCSVTGKGPKAPFMARRAACRLQGLEIGARSAPYF